MTNVELKARKRKRKVLSRLICASWLLNFSAIACILVLFTAGLIADGGGYGFLRYIRTPDVALVSFDALDRSRYLGGNIRVYWTLNAFSWYAPEAMEWSADSVYVQPGHALRFPDVIHELTRQLTYTVLIDCSNGSNTYSDNCGGLSTTYPEAFDGAPPLTLHTAPAFTFYIVVVLLSLGAVAFEWFKMSCTKDWRVFGQENTILDTVRLTVALIMLLVHVIAAGIVTWEAVRLLGYLEGFWEIHLRPELGKYFLVDVWAGFAANLAAGFAVATTVVLKNRWVGTYEKEDAGSIAMVGNGDSTYFPRASESNTIQTELPRYEIIDPLGRPPPMKEGSRYRIKIGRLVQQLRRR